MKAVGIIAEYNPFHNGHLYHLARAKELTGADVSVAVISGNFTQRGEASLNDKWARAETAVKSGVDLVMEMPFVFACNNAGYFGRSGINILEAMHVHSIAFGTETDNLDKLRMLADFLNVHESEIEGEASRYIKDGFSYPKARQAAIKKMLNTDPGDILNPDSPNNTLAIEYLRAVRYAKPVAIPRIGPGYNYMEASGRYASATYIRSLVSRGESADPYLPYDSTIIMYKCLSDDKAKAQLFKALITKLMSMDKQEASCIFGSDDGLGSLLINNFRYFKSYDDVISTLKSKRYTRTRINRVIINTILGIRNQDIERAVNYSKVLAFNDKGSAYLKEIKRNYGFNIPIITNINKEPGDYPQIAETLKWDIMATDLYNFISSKDLYQNSEYVKKPLKIQC